MSKNRKDDHITFAREQTKQVNDFSKVRLLHHSIPTISVDDINLQTTFLNSTFSYPFYINAMTGGNEEGNALNYKLARIAAFYNIPFFIGSQSLAFKEPGVKEQYKALRATFPQIFIVANINPNFTLEMAQEAISMVGANALAIHVNSIQELVMAEGDRDFTKWLTNIKTIVKGVKVPVIVKEVGYGMAEVTLKQLINIGVKYIDISGKGGTDFTKIESRRNKVETSAFASFGISTAESLLLAKDLPATIFASGGVTNGVDVVKALALGAKAVGMARFFLDAAYLDDEEARVKVDELIAEIKKTMVLLNVKTPSEISEKHIFKSPLV